MYQFGILAYPASHSLSPSMHNAVFAEKKSEAFYRRYEISPPDLSGFMSKWRSDTTKEGLSVSIPHKETIAEYCDEIDESAEIIGAVNTLYKKNGRIYGTNTDWQGFQRSLENQYDTQNKRYIVLGAGGASRAIIYALISLGSKKIYIWNRTEETAKELVREFAKISANVFFLSSEDLSSVSLETDCIINTTSVGMSGKLETLSPFPKELFQAFHTAFDIVYTPQKTVFLQDCENAGGKSFNGEDMLLFQGVAQSQLFYETMGQDVSSSSIESSMKKGLEKATRTPESWQAPLLTIDQKKNILQTIVHTKQTDLFLSREFLEYSPLEKNENEKFLFWKALQPHQETPHLIAEIKPASPSKGKIFTDTDSVESIASMYEKNGVSCVSVLTDYPFFGASIENIAKAKKTISLPIIRKDFIIDISQINEAHAFGASCVLLMRSVLSSVQIEEFLQHAQMLGMDCLVEVHDEIELRDVLENTSSRIIGVNTRDLKTLQINPKNFQTLLDIAKTYPDYNEKLYIAESGISSFADVKKYASQADAILVGTGILLSDDREKKVRELANM